MARLDMSDTDILSGIADNSRETVRSIVEAGANAAAKRMQDNIRLRGHVRTGDMLEGTGPGPYREWLGGGAVDVYPQGNDRYGTRNATKAYVINYGRGGTRKKSSKMGDKFITGDEKKAEEAVYQAMQAEADRLAEEMNGGK